MNGLNKFMNGLYKVVAPCVEFVFSLFLTIAGNMGIQSYKVWKALGSISIGDLFSDDVPTSSGTGFLTFIQILYWLIAVAFLACKALNVYQAITSNPQALNSIKSMTAPAPQNNAYAQPQQNFAQPVQQNIPAQQSIPTPAPIPTPAAAGAEKFCTQCGAKVPAGNTFCTGCGAKLD